MIRKTAGGMNMDIKEILRTAAKTDEEMIEKESAGCIPNGAWNTWPGRKAAQKAFVCND